MTTPSTAPAHSTAPTNHLRHILSGQFLSSWGLSPRYVFVLLLVTFTAMAAFIMGLGAGDYPLTPSEVLKVLSGHGSSLERMVVFEWRLGRTLVAMAVGLALGMAGAITQSVTRNALASPDILGISMGASAAVVWVIGFSTHLMHPMIIPVVAILGAMITAVVIVLLARGNNTNTYRLVLIGIGVHTLLSSAVSFVLASTESDSAALAIVWLTGSVNGRGLVELIPVIIVLLFVSFLVAPNARHLRPLQLGENSALSLGVNLTHCRVLMLSVAVALTAVAVAAAGPVSFVAFVSPQLALRLLRTPYPPLIGSAVCGSTLVLIADLVARVALPWELPVGIVTAALGGPFLLYVIVTIRRKTTL